MYSYIKWFELAAAIIAISNWPSLRKSPFLKWLAILILFITAAEFSGFFIKEFKKYNAVFYNFFVEPGLFTLYSIAFSNGYKNKRNKKFAKWSLLFVLVIYFASLYFVNYERYLNVIGYNFGALYIASLAILMILEIIILSEDINYFKNPITILMVFLFFYYLITIPHYSITYYYYHESKSNWAALFLKYFNTALNYLLYFCYAITFLLWGRKKPLS